VTHCRCGTFDFPAGVGAYVTNDGRHTATSCPADRKPEPDLDALLADGWKKLGTTPTDLFASRIIDGEHFSPVAQLHACEGLLPPAIAEQVKEFARSCVLQPRREGKTAEPVIYAHTQAIDADGVRRLVSDPACRPWSSKPQPPPTQEQMLASIEKAFLRPPRPSRPFIVSPEVYEAYCERFAPPEPQVQLVDEPSPEECATLAVCEFLRWGATPTPIICSCGCGLDIG
jgi:hypothetical protein